MQKGNDLGIEHMEHEMNEYQIGTAFFQILLASLLTFLTFSLIGGNVQF